MVGLGRAGSAYDAPDSPVVRSHVGAVRSVEGLSLVAGVDRCGEARDAATERWGSNPAWLADIGELSNGAAEIIALCTPPSGRLELVERAIEKRPRLLIVEKPLAESLWEAQAISAAAAATTLRVNFHRRMDPGHAAFRDALPGTPRHVVGRYGKGLFNYAPHMVDLLIDWFGTVDSVQAVGPPPSDDAPSLSMRCRMAAGFDAVLLGIDGLDYDQFELDFFFDTVRMELADGGTTPRVYRPVDGLHYPGYSQLGDATAFAAPGPVGGLTQLYVAARDHLHDGAPMPGCTGVQAVAGLRVIDSALESARRSGIEIQVTKGNDQ